MGARLEFRILGPLEVRVDATLRRVSGRRQRALLALLLCNANQVVGRDRLVDALLGDQPIESAERMLRVQVSRLRKALAADGDSPRITARPPGYVLRVEPGELDLHEFERLLSEGRSALERGDPARAALLLRRAESLWQGRPLADLEAEAFAQVEIRRLEALRLAGVEDRIEAELELGRHTLLCPELEALVDEHPLRERLRGQLMLALYRTGRQADALATYRAGRALLVDELALEPGLELKRLEQAILTHDAALQPARPRASTDAEAALTGDATAEGSASESNGRSPRRRRFPVAVIGGAGVTLLVIAGTVATMAWRSQDPRRVAPDSLAAIDVRSNRVAAVVPVGSSPGPVASGSGALWVADVGDQTVARVDPAKQRTVRTLSVGGTPTGLAASADAIWVVQANPGSDSVSVRRIDPQFDTVGPRRRLGNVVPGGPGSVAARGRSVWVAPSSGLLTRLDPRTGRVAHRLDPNAAPAGIGLGAGALWVTDGDADNVTRIDRTGLRTPIAVGNGPSAIAVGAHAVWVADALDNAVVRIDPDTAAVTTTIRVGRSPMAIAVGAGSIWVANSGDGSVSRIDPATNEVAATIHLGGSPHGITVTGARAWVTVDAAPTAARLATRSGTLRMETLADVDHLDPALAYAPGAWQLLFATCAKLLNYPDRSGAAGAQLIPEVARSLPARSDDGRTYTFTIRPGFRFSPPSNETVTAATFKHTIERTLSPAMKSPVAYEFTNIAGARAYMAGRTNHIAGVRARGDTLTIRLLRPQPDFPSRIAQPFFCAVPSNTPIDPGGVRLIPSAGPYYVASYTPGQGVVLVRNPRYTRGRPHRFERIALTLGVSSQRAAADVEAGRADYTTIGGSPGSAIVALARRLAARFGPHGTAATAHRQQYFASPLPELDFFVLNTHRPLFRDRRLRQAVNYAVDRRALARYGDGFGSADRPTDQYLPPTVPGSGGRRVYPLSGDRARARKLAHVHGRTAVLYACNYAACRQLAALVRNDLATIGLRVHVRTFDHVTLYARLARRHEPFDLAPGTWMPDYPDPAAMLNGMLAGPTYPSFDDRRYRRRLAAADRLVGPERYLAFRRIAQTLLRRAAPIIPYGNGTNQEFFSARIGCQTYGFYYGVDLAAACIRRVH